MIEIQKANFNRDYKFIVDAQLAMAYETEKLRLNPEVLGHGVHAVFHDGHKGQYYIALHEGQPVGSLMITFEWSDWRNKVVWWIQSVYVKPEFRGQGIYKKMYEHIQAQALSHQAAGLRLYVDKTNIHASNVYAKLGMDGGHYNLFEKMF
jgi:GNAT superfamily N-acetyltransferase